MRSRLLAARLPARSQCIFQPVRRVFAGVAQKNFRLRRCVQGCRAWSGMVAAPATIGIGRPGRRAQEITGFIMRAEKRLDFAMQRRVAGAPCCHEFAARGAGGQFDCTGKYNFSAGRRWVHRARNSGSDCNSQARRREPKADRRSRTIASAPFKRFHPKEAARRL